MEAMKSHIPCIVRIRARNILHAQTAVKMYEIDIEFPSKMYNVWHGTLHLTSFALVSILVGTGHWMLFCSDVGIIGWMEASKMPRYLLDTNDLYRMRDKWRTIKGILLPLMTERSSHRAREQDDEVVKKNLQKYLKSALTRAKPQHAQYSHFDNSEALIYARTLINISIHFPHKNVCGTRVSRVYPNNIPHILGRSLKPYLVVGSIRKI